MRHLVRVARSFHNDLARVPHPASQYVVGVDVVGLPNTVRLWLPRDDLVFDIKVQIANRANILPMFQHLSREGVALELDDYTTLRTAGFEPPPAVTTVRIASKQDVRKQAASREYQALYGQVAARNEQIARLRKAIAASAKDEKAWNNMANLIAKKK